MIGVPISIAFSKPVITPEEKVVHPNPIMAKMITTSRSRPNSPIIGMTVKLAIKIYVIFITETCTIREDEFEVDTLTLFW